ncbi:MAG: TauD/TfdA family dioxygenase, partial [Bacteroidota bacterium]
RTHSDTENLIGLFLNVLPLKNEIATGMTISEFVDSVKNNSLEAFDNQLYPFDMLVDDLKVERNSSRFPLFDVGFTWQNIEVGSQDSAVAGVSVEGFSYDFQHVKTDLWFHGWKSDQELNFSITYNKDLFESKTIEGYVEDFKTLFQTILTNPESQVSKVADEIRKARLVKKESRSKSMKKSRFKKFQDIEVKPISFSKEDLVSIDESSEYPLVIKPNIDDLVLAKWVQENNQLLQERLRSNGAILFRGFNIKNQDHFQEILSALEGESMNYSDQSSPRTLVADKVYTSTDHPSDQVINMHNELSYSHDWPLTISFYCDIPPVENGETPIADTRKVLKMLSPATREKFEEHGVLYMRNLVDGLGLSWQQVYQTDDKSKVEEHCKKKGINFEWFSDEHLRISWKRPAVQTNPITKEKAWFNHGFFFNAANLDQAIHDVIQDEELLPFNTYFGNGDKIDEAVFDELKSAYAQCKVKFKWQKGDLLVLDNMCMAHGRESYSGDRKILVGMNRPHSIVVNGTN